MVSSADGTGVVLAGEDADNYVMIVKPREKEEKE